MQVIEKCDKKVIKSNVAISLLCVQISVSNCILSIITTCVTLYSNTNIICSNDKSQSHLSCNIYLI